MDSKKTKKLMIISVVITAAIVIILTAAGFAASNIDYRPSSWVIRSYKNNVALYHGDELNAVYGKIKIDELPPEDIRLLETGISFPTKEEAEKALEDYDG